MRIHLKRQTGLVNRHLAFILAIVIGAAMCAFSYLPGGLVDAHVPINDVIAFDRDDQLFIVNSDGTGLEPRGSGYGPSFSPDGSQLALTFADSLETNVIYKMDATGDNRVQLTESFQEHDVAWSPAGTQIAFVSERTDPEYSPGEDLFVTSRLYLMNADGSGEQKLMTRAQSHTATHVIEEERGPTWFRDASQLAFIGHTRTASGGSRTNIYIVNRDGSGLREITHFDNGRLGGVDKISWSPDGAKIAFQMNRDIHVVNVDGLSEPVNLTNTSDREESDPAFSPFGSRIAYVVNHFNDDTKDGLYIMKADGTNQRQVLASTGAGQQIARPAWHPLAHDPTEEPPPSPSPKADMSIGLTALPAQPTLGNDVTYTLTVKNNGPTNVTGSFASFHRSQNLDLVSAVTPQGTCQQSSSDPLGTICATGPLAVGASTAVTIVVRPSAVGEVSLAGTVGSPLIDPDPSNNSQTLNVTVVPAPVPNCVPEVTSEVQQIISRPGNQSRRRVRHVITVRNTSGRTLNGLVHFVFDGLPDSITDGDPRTTFFRTRCALPLGRQYTTRGVLDLVWHPGQVIQFDVDFFNPENVPVNYNLRIYTGPGFP